MAKEKKEYTKEQEEKIAAGMQGLGREKKGKHDWLKEKWGKAKERGGKAKEKGKEAYGKVKDRSFQKICPNCGTGNPRESKKCKNCGANIENLEKPEIQLTKIGKILKNGITFVVSSGISIASLFLLYNPIFSFLDKQFPFLADILLTPFLFFSVGHWILIISGLLIGLVLIISTKRWEWQIGTPIMLLIIVAVGVFSLGMVSGYDISSLISSLGNPQALFCSLIGSDNPMFCPQIVEDGISYAGYKSYDTLGIEIGNKRFREGKTTYEIPTPYGYTDNVKSDYVLPIYIKNLNDEDTEGGGLVFSNIVIGNGDDRENVELRQTHVWAYVNRTIGRRSNANPFLYEAQTIDICDDENECTLGPEDELKIFASYFAGGYKVCIIDGYSSSSTLGGCTECSINYWQYDPCPNDYSVINGVSQLSYFNTFPCEDQGVQQLEFEIKLRYDSSVVHTRTLVLANTEDDEYIASRQGAIKHLSDEIPTDGPVDLIIDFDSPYILEEMRRNEIRMTIEVVNGKETGKYKPIDIDDKAAITIEALGSFEGGFPSWLTGVSGDCTRDGNQITISEDDFYKGGQKKFLEGSRSFVCNLEIDPESAIVDVQSYKSFSFVGNLTYRYLDGKNFFGWRNSVPINREFCPGCPYYCRSEESCGDKCFDTENIDEYFCNNVVVDGESKTACCCREPEKLYA